MNQFRRHFSAALTQKVVLPVHSTSSRIAALEKDSMYNIGPSVLNKLDRHLLSQPNHPLALIKAHIATYFSTTDPACPLLHFDHFDPIVGVKENFDDLCFPADHPGRSKSDSYFINERLLLRTHMTANELEYLKAGKRAFLIAGDVYRRDQIDSTHYPVFHQLEGVRVFDSHDALAMMSNADKPSQFLTHGFNYNWETQPHHTTSSESSRLLRCVTDDLYTKLTGLMKFLFGPEIPLRWQRCHFPFTCPSFEVEVLHRGKWIEVCGSGVLQQSILSRAGIPSSSSSLNQMAWAFGLGLERLAMIMFDIPDIRLFWSEDERFLGQFKTVHDRFKPFSKYPVAKRDLSFWIGSSSNSGKEAAATAAFDENGMYDLIREIGGDLIENVALIDEYSVTEGRKSRCYRITFRSLSRTLTDTEVNAIQDTIRRELPIKYDVTLR